MSNYFLVSTKCYSRSQKCKDFMHIKSSHLDHGCILAPHEYASVVNVPPLLSPPLVPGILFNLLFFLVDGRIGGARLRGKTYIHATKQWYARNETIVASGVGDCRATRFNPLRRPARITFQMNQPPRGRLRHPPADHFCF